MTLHVYISSQLIRFILQEPNIWSERKREREKNPSEGRILSGGVKL